MPPSRDKLPGPSESTTPGRRGDAARWVRDALRSQIMEGAFGGLAAATPALPPEERLAAEFRVSRNAVREALNLLRDEGLITRTPGVGTFVSGAKLGQPLDRLEGLTESLAGHKLPVGNAVLSVREVTANTFVAHKLGLTEASPVLFVERLRSVGRVPLSLDTSYLRPDAIPGLLDADLAQVDIFTLLESRLGLTLGWAEVTTEAVSADQQTARLLRVRPGSPLLLVHRLTHLDDGTPFDLEAIRYRGDRVRLTTAVPRQEDRKRPGTSHPPVSDP